MANSALEVVRASTFFAKRGGFQPPIGQCLVRGIGFPSFLKARTTRAPAVKLVTSENAAHEAACQSSAAAILFTIERIG